MVNQVPDHSKDAVWHATNKQAKRHKADQKKRELQAKEKK